jgi:low affinity Fe/Cu permease
MMFIICIYCIAKSDFFIPAGFTCQDFINHPVIECGEKNVEPDQEDGSGGSGGAGLGTVRGVNILTLVISAAVSVVFLTMIVLIFKAMKKTRDMKKKMEDQEPM